MNSAARIAILLVALLHVYFLIMEMFLWTKPVGMKAFGLTPERAESSRVLAMNQGLYNGFLAAGLLWAIDGGGFHVALFFLACVIIAGIFGGLTANKKILLVQALPGVIALVLLHIR